MLILAVVAIGAVQNDGIIDHAKNSRDQYGAAQTNENSTIQSYLDKIQEHVGTGSGAVTGTGEKTEEDRITFYYEGIMRIANKGDTWLTWLEDKEQMEPKLVDGYLVLIEKLVCYDDGTWVKAEEEIRERILLYDSV